MSQTFLAAVLLAPVLPKKQKIMAKRILMVLTNHGEIEGTEHKTGWYLPELAHPFLRFVKVFLMNVHYSLHY